MTESLTHSVSLFLKRQCDRTLGDDGLLAAAMRHDRAGEGWPAVELYTAWLG